MRMSMNEVNARKGWAWCQSRAAEAQGALGGGGGGREVRSKQTVS